MLKLRVAALLAALLLPSAALAQDAEQAIREGLSRFAVAFNKGDLATIQELYTKDAVALPPGAPAVQGREAISAIFKGMVDAGLGDMALNTLEVVVLGDLAISRDAVSLSVPGQNGKRMQLEGKDIVVWKKEGGVWRMHRDIWNLNVQ